MDSFPFTFSINYKMEIFKLKPPSNFTLLKEATCEKFDITLCKIFFIDESGYEKEIKDDNDYFNLINILTEEKYSEIELIIKTEKDISKHRKISLRKRSSMRENNNISASNHINAIDEDDEYNQELGMQNDYNYFGDTRNRKGMYDEGYTKQNKGYNEQKRIYYIKEKKNMQRMEQIQNEEEEEEEEEEEDRRHKRKLKNKTQKNIDENNNYYEIVKPVKKKKNPKKERTKW